MSNMVAGPVRSGQFEFTVEQEQQAWIQAADIQQAGTAGGVQQAHLLRDLVELAL